MTNRGLIHNSETDHDNDSVPGLTASSDSDREDGIEELIRIIRGKEETKMDTGRQGRRRPTPGKNTRPKKKEKEERKEKRRREGRRRKRRQGGK